MTASAAERVYAHLKAAILDGTLAGGVLLTEGQVADEVGVSRTPVREAMLRLEAEGMLRLYPKKGALVVPVSSAEAEDVIEARALVETWAAQRLGAASQQHLATQLEELVDQMRAHQAAGDVGAFSADDRTFHETIVAAAGNQILTRVYRSLRERQICLSSSIMRFSTERMTAAVADHDRLVDLLRAGDHEQFAALLDRHLAGAAAQLRNAR